MNLNILSVDFSVTPEIREFINHKFTKLEKYAEQIIDSQIVLSGNLEKKTASITIRVKGKDIHSSASDESLYAAIDLLIDKITRQLVETKTKKIQKRIVDSAKRLEIIGIA